MLVLPNRGITLRPHSTTAVPSGIEPVDGGTLELPLHGFEVDLVPVLAVSDLVPADDLKAVIKLRIGNQD